MPSAHPIIALWSHPRSTSTAIERIMRERGDCACFHEPFLYDYYVHRGLREIPMLERPAGQPESYEEIRAMLLEAGERGPVFFKDMSYYVVPRIFEDTDFAERLTNTFLIRDPRRSIVSYHRLDPAMTCTEVGLAAQWEHFSFLRERLGRPPLVIESEAVGRAPAAMMKAYWKGCGLPFLAQALEWQAETPEDWKPVAGWHQTVTGSTGIRRQSGEEEARAAFEKAAAEAPHLRDYLEAHGAAYEALRGFALAPDQA
ncbi:MAG: hypothetical protein OEM59_20945 [Rhodospirillales bacterium]|nr:hypothetical protein [Rhodospirillales bacterium]